MHSGFECTLSLCTWLSDSSFCARDCCGCLQLCGGGYVLDLQLPGGPAHVVLLSLLALLSNLRERASTLLTPTETGSAKVLLRLPVQVRHGSLACFV